MEKVSIWYQTNNDEGLKVAGTIKAMGLSINVLTDMDFSSVNVLPDEINIFIIDLIDIEPEKILVSVEKAQVLQGVLKFVILKKKEIKEMNDRSYNMLHLEFISRPVEKREFLLLLEKSIIVERYREMMKFVSHQSDTRVEIHENLMDINRKSVFDSEKEKKAFSEILKFEKNLYSEQKRLNHAIKDFTETRQKDYFDIINRVKPEDILPYDINVENPAQDDIIEAQENVIDFSAGELKNAHKILSASEQVAELSRSEALELHEKLEQSEELARYLSMEIERLLAENQSLKDKVQALKS